MSASNRGRWLGGLLSGPGVAFALVPACPACWPLYAGLLGSLGLGAMTDLRFQLPFTLLLLGIALAALAFRARGRRGYGPAGLGGLGAAVILIGKFALVSAPVSYVGAGALVLASVWNIWPRRAATCAACDAGEIGNTDLQPDGGAT